MWTIRTWYLPILAVIPLALPVDARANPMPRAKALDAKAITVSTSSEVGRLRGKDHTAKAAADGKVGDGYWCTAFDSKPPHWLIVDFGSARQFGEIILHLYESSALRSCRIERWDGSDWAFVAEASSQPRPTGDFTPAWEFGDGPTGVIRCQFPAITSDKVRLWFEKDTSIRLYEVEVPPLAAADDAPAAPGRFDASAPLIQIGFGRRNAVAEPGWFPIDAASAYSADNGIGWVGNGHRIDCDRRGGAPFARRFVGGWSEPGRLRIDLPPGRYFATLVTSDFALPVRPFEVARDGLPSGPTLRTASRGAWDVRRFRIEVGANGCELTFRGDAGWRINALLIAPEANLNALLVESDRLEEQLALGSPEWMDKRMFIPAPPAADSFGAGVDQQRGYVLFRGAPVERIYPQTRPRPDQIDRPLSARGTVGEAVVTTLGVVPLVPMFDMKLATADLTGPGGAKIPASALDARITRCWPQIDKTPAGRGKVRIIPELLERQDRHPAVCAAIGATRQYWITTRIPDDAVPGEYQGHLKFSADGVPPTDVPLQLTVLPFRLQMPPEKTFFMYSIFADDTDAEIISSLRDMRDHGMNSLAPDLAGGWEKRPGKPPAFDGSPVRRILALAKQEGFHRPMPWHAANPIRGIDAPQGSETWTAALAGILGQVRGIQDEVGGQEVLFYPVDEPFGNEERLALAEVALRVAKKSLALRTYCTPAEKDIPRLDSLLDVRCYAIGSVTNVSAAAASSRAAGASFWWYTNAARELPDVRRYLAGVWFWSTGSDGQGYWVYQSRWRRSRPFQDLEGDLHSHDYVAYPDVDGPIPTIQWECIRMGIDDARYLYTLDAAISANQNHPKASDARNFLDELRRGMPERVEPPGQASILYACAWSSAEFDRLRDEAIHHIMALQSTHR